jgi:molybdopterin-synthase adenylyltransferase
MAVLEPPDESLGEHSENSCGCYKAHSALIRNAMNYSVAIAEELDEALLLHLIRRDGQEDLCFALWNPSQGENRTTALIHAALFPREGERRVHGNASFLPPYFERVVEEALRENCGIAFLHSHPGPGWQDMSEDDIQAESSIAAQVFAATELPLVGLTVGSDGTWSARFWERKLPNEFIRRWCENVRSVGLQLRVSFSDSLCPPPPEIEDQVRTVSAWGYLKQANLSRLRVGVVGTGSVGAIVAEALARTGISRITLIDFDIVKRHNLDRLLHSTRLDAYLASSKVSVLARGIRRSATAPDFRVHEVVNSLSEPEGFKAALDCDVLFSCVDRPLGRSILNFVSFAHLIPVIDGGIRVEVDPNGDMKAADWKILASSPRRRCLECAGQYTPATVSLEREGFLDDPEYIRGLPENDPLKRNENVFAFSANVASFEVMQLLQMVVAPRGISDAGEQMYHFVPAIFDSPIFEMCKPTCPYPGLIATGDRSGITVTSPSLVAQAARDGLRNRPWPKRALDRVLGVIWQFM